MNIDDAIKGVVDRIRDEYRPEKIILFGSRVWGEADSESDLDILVIGDSDKRGIDRIRDVSRIVDRFQRRPYSLSLDILVKTPEEIKERLAIGDEFIREVLTRGRVVYERVMV
jgi:predicted nucleotidyltransferase